MRHQYEISTLVSQASIDHSRNTITNHNALCLSRQKILHKHCLQFLLGVKMARRETENNVYMQNLGWQTKSIMVCNGIFWSGQLAGKPLVASRNVVCFLKLHLFKLLHKKVRGCSNVWKLIHKNLKLWQMWTFANKVTWHVTAKNSKPKMAKVYDYSPLSLSLLD